MDKVSIATKIAWSMLNTPYIWGGDDPMKGFDCSGFVIEILKSLGLVSIYDDLTAAQIYEKFKKYEQDSPDEGSLIFWSNNKGKIVHVEYAIDSEHTIGASGGGSKTLTVQDAINQNAYIKVRTIKSKLNSPSHIVNPF